MIKVWWSLSDYAPTRVIMYNWNEMFCEFIVVAEKLSSVGDRKLHTEPRSKLHSIYQVVSRSSKQVIMMIGSDAPQ